MSQQPILLKSNLKQISDKVTDPYHNSILELINDHWLRISVMTGEYRWHYNAHTNELFYILEGKLKIEIKDEETVLLHSGEFIKIPK